VSVVAPRPGGAFGWPGAAARIRERPARVWEAVRWVTAARRQLASLGADRVVAHWAIPSAFPIATPSRGLLATATPQWAELEIVSHGGDVRLLCALPAIARRHIVRSLASAARPWSFVSQALLDDLTASLDAETRSALERVATIRPAPIELPDVSVRAAELRKAFAGSRLAVCVGRLVATKRFERAVVYVADRADQKRCSLVVVGDGPERGTLERFARTRGVDARFVGAVGRSEALAWIRAADVLLHASEAEGLSTVVREAEALGTRVERLY
jgi:teichuronic acid biosynthesis glycosyltransferase TuaC